MASTDTPIDHSCEAWLADSSIIPNDIPPLPYDQFYIKIYTNFRRLPSHAADDDDDFLMTIDAQDCTTTTVTQFWIPTPLLIGDDSSCSVVSEMLSEVGVPLDLHPFMIYRISSTAQFMAADAHNVGRSVLPMLVSIDVIQYDDDGLPQESADAEGALLPLPVPNVARAA